MFNRIPRFYGIRFGFCQSPSSLTALKKGSGYETVTKSKERMRALARFPVLKGPIRRQTVRAKQAGHFPLFNCSTLASQHVRVKKLERSGLLWRSVKPVFHFARIVPKRIKNFFKFQNFVNIDWLVLYFRSTPKS